MAKISEREMLLDARIYIQIWFNRPENSRVKTGTTAFQSCFLDYLREFKAYKVLNNSKDHPVSDKALKAAFEEHNAQEGERNLELVAKKLCEYGQPGLDILKAWVAAVTGGVNELDLAVVAHWLWMVKRRALGLEVVYHVMPVFYGQQDGGKSTAVRKLLQPLYDVVAPLKMDELTDSRNYHSFGEYLVAFFDELHGIERTDLKILKNLITTDRNNYRVLYTHNRMNAYMRCSFIGATNVPLNENFSDPTGMRRFFQITTMPQCHWSTINGLDYELLWKQIDETLERGYMTEQILPKVRERQAELVDEDLIDIFIREHAMRVGEIGKILPKQALYDAYTLWAGRNGIRETSSQWITKRLKNRGFVSYREAGLDYFKVGLDCNIGPDGRMLKVLKKEGT